MYHARNIGVEALAVLTYELLGFRTARVSMTDSSCTILFALSSRLSGLLTYMSFLFSLFSFSLSLSFSFILFFLFFFSFFFFAFGKKQSGS